MNEGIVRRYAQVTVAVNLQQVRRLIQDERAWCYSLAFDDATNNGDSILDVRVRLCVNAAICNYNLLSIPMKDSHTGQEYFNAVRSILTTVP